MEKDSLSFSPEADILAATKDAVAIILDHGVDTYATVRAHISTLLSGGAEMSPEDIFEEIREEEADIPPSVLSDVIGRLLSINPEHEGAVAALAYVEAGRELYGKITPGVEVEKVYASLRRVMGALQNREI